MVEKRPVTVTVNGQVRQAEVEPRRTLADFLREDLNLPGTHLGCEHGVCGNCTVLLDGQSVRACLMFAVQADGHEILTVEGLVAPNGDLHPLQEAFWEHHALQCGFCTPAMLLTAYEYLQQHPVPGSDEEIREAIGGVLCRCTGYQNIVTAIRAAATKLTAAGPAPASRSVAD
ncbi:MAG: (2Fe-2S)-binding protein [Sphaerobacter sp.]|nr:(2Fe-2S)-binding protein [Sphaerobacter sp.]